MNFLDMLSLFLSTLPHCLSDSCLVFKSQFRCHLLGETFLATLPNVAHSPVQFSVPSLCFLHNVRHIEVLCLIVYLLLPFRRREPYLHGSPLYPNHMERNLAHGRCSINVCVMKLNEVTLISTQEQNIL